MHEDNELHEDEIHEEHGEKFKKLLAKRMLKNNVRKVMVSNQLQSLIQANKAAKSSKSRKGGKVAKVAQA